MKTKIICILSILTLVSFSFIGSDCNDILTEVVGGGGDLTGSWKLLRNDGSTHHDICPGEVVTFPNTTGGNATLKCPNTTEITKAYTINGTALRYTASGVEYQYTVANNGTVLVLENSSRKLTYTSNVNGKPEGNNNIK